MSRIVAIVLMAACITGPAWAQAQPVQAQSTSPATKSVARKPAPKTRSAKQAVPPITETGPCDMGVIAAAGDVFTVQKYGLTIFNEEYAEVPVSWGLDDLIFARAKAAGGAGVHRIVYPKGAFDLFYHPKSRLIRDENEKLDGILRQIAGTSNCARYLVVTRMTAPFNGNRQTTLTGIGVLNHGTSLYSRSYVYAYLDLQLFDGRTFELLSNPNVNLKRVLGNMAEDLTTNRNMTQVDNSAFPASPPDVAGSTTLRDMARQVVSERLDKDMPAYFKTDEQ